jgi:hypothetical protein
MTKLKEIHNIHIMDTSNGLYANLNDVLTVLLKFHAQFPSRSSQAIYNSLKEARKEWYDTQSDIDDHFGDELTPP